MIEREEKIQVDIDLVRIRAIAGEAVRMIYEYVGGDFTRTEEEILQQVEKILASNKITTQFFINMGSKKIPDLLLRIDPVDKKVLCKSQFTKKVAEINHFMRIL